MNRTIFALAALLLGLLSRPSFAAEPRTEVGSPEAHQERLEPMQRTLREISLAVPQPGVEEA